VLKQRVVTALLMMLTFLVALFWMPPEAFIVFSGLVFLVGAWEWSDLSGFASFVSRAFYVLSCFVLGGVAYFYTEAATQLSIVKPLLIGACAWWAVALLWVQGFPASAILWRPQPVRAVMGLFVLIPSWLSVVYLIQIESGAQLVLLCLLIVAAVDVGAYFSGRKFGRHKLAPLVSPGKTWEGVWGGLTLSVVVAFVFVAIFSDELSIVSVLIITAPAALVSIVGDLLESMVKRERGIKDSGTILPGHGGVLDRIDGLLPAVPAFSLAVLLSHWHL